jgi:hypothetical protein
MYRLHKRKEVNPLFKASQISEDATIQHLCQVSGRVKIFTTTAVRADRTTNSRPDRDLCRHRDRTPGAIECILSNQYDRTPDQKFSAGSTIVLGREFTLQTRF